MGNVLQPQNALPVRPSNGSPAAAAEPANAEALGRQLRAGLPPMRLHSVSIYDSQGNVLWLSEGALGPDEHSLVLDALERLSADSGKGCCEHRLEDGRIAAFLAVRAPQGHLVGLAMILADYKSIIGEGLMDRIMSAHTRTILQKVAVFLRPAGSTGLVLSLAASEAAATAAESVAATASVPAQSAAPKKGARKAEDELTPGAMNDILEFELTDTPMVLPARAGNPASPADSASTRALDSSAAADSGSVRAPILQPAADTASSRLLKQATPATDTTSSRILASPAATGAARAVSLDPALVTLEMLPFVKLRSGGRMRRFEVLPAGTARELRDPAVLDSLAMQHLLAWLGAHRAAWTVEPASFTLNLSIATLEDEGFLRQVAAGLQSNGIAPDTVGFEIAEPLCTQRRAQVERFMAGCEQLGCFVVIDDFSFDSAVLPLLRSKALRLVKIDGRLTGGALRDKLSQALVVAVVQAVKVLGMHCAAQQVDSEAALQWLSAVGCDFAQGPMLARQQPLETLLGTAL
ncbi:MAG TPA: EAL domain-containing protein [Steroidobacteraceae bacterium]|jgi:EAL domain-containing protein (putative c-di-GMP-specific phosphodiesterase class I)|nr:EAL domain-containing protein [Steroidobacteraceae bacterium]